MSLASMTPEQQKTFREAEACFHGFNPSNREQTMDALISLEKLVLIGNADNVNSEGKHRVGQLREAIRTKIAERR